jgi:pimeloyl-ACP methyl ester carboxylesterase
MALQTHLVDGIDYLERPGAPGAPVLLLLHGIGSNANSFLPSIAELSDDWHVIAWNAPGYGRSEPLSSEWPLAFDYAEALHRLVTALKLDRVLLAGHSLGTLIGAAYAAAHRDRVARLLLASPALGHGMSRGSLSPTAQARIDDLHRLGAPAFAAARAARLVYRPEDNPMLVARVRESMEQVKSPGYYAAARMLASGRLLDDAARLFVPTDVIVGAEDVVTPPDGARRVHAALREEARGNLGIVPGAGHAIYLQAPAAFAAALGVLVETAC